MTSVIRSSRVDEEPRVLVRVPRESPHRGEYIESVAGPCRSDNPAAERDSTSEDRAGNTSSMSAAYSIAEDSGAPVRVETPLAADPISYDEYQSRFREELDEMRGHVREAAYREGHAEGLNEGRNAGAAEYSEKRQRLDVLFTSARETIEQNLDGLADMAVEIVFESVAKILGAQFADRVGTEAVVREVIRQSKERSKLVVRVSPLDYEMLADSRTELADAMNTGQVDFVADDLIELGGCVLETPSGSLDGRLEIQIQRFRETLLNARIKWHEHGD